MQNEPQTLSIQLLDKTWQIRCPADKTHELQKCARYLDTKMHEIAEQGKKTSEHIAVMAAINAIYELFSQQTQKDLYIESLSSRIRELQNSHTQVRTEEL
jgi:cell division protein ZapA